MKMKDECSEYNFWTCVFAVIVFAVIAAGLIGISPPESKPIKLPTVERVAEKTGEVTAKAGRGFFRGMIDELKRGKN